MKTSTKQIVEDGLFQFQRGTILVNGKYRVIAKIGSGARSTVYSILSQKGQKKHVRAIKVESNTVKEPQIKTEVSVLKTIKGSNPDETGFAQIYQYGEEDQYNYMIMSLLGPNLEQLLKLCGGSFSLKTTMIIALQILDRLQVLHQYGYLHGDICPQNCMMGLYNETPYVFLADFGRTRKYKSKDTGQHISYKQNVPYAFNAAFASVNAHNSVQASRRDDLESLIYMINFIKFGKLPWYKPYDGKRREFNIQDLKKKLTPEIISYKMPIEMIDLLYYIKSIEFYEKPDYDFIRKMFYRCLERQEFDNFLTYDWNKLEDVDFKVYNGEPKIIMKGSAGTGTGSMTIGQKGGDFSSEAQLEKSQENDEEGSALLQCQ